jgi:hypothetical protein
MHEILEPVDEEEVGFGIDDKFDQKEYKIWLNSSASSRWEKSTEPKFCHYVNYLPDTVILHIKKFTDKYQFDFSNTIQSYYWMSHCEYCGAKQGDYELYEEPKGPFFPITEEEAFEIKLSFINEYFEASGSVSFEQELFHKMDKLDKL